MLLDWLKSSYKEFAATVSQGRAPSSLIICGEPQLGCSYLALECAKLYLCKDSHDDLACNACKSCNLINDISASNPDVLCLLNSTAAQRADGLDFTHVPQDLIENMDGSEALDSKGKTVAVDSIRKLTTWCSEGSVFGNGKVAIVSNAHTMNENASNALLKTFEEPSENTLIILLTKSFDALPNTILSRAFKIQVKPVLENDALNYIKSNNLDNYDESKAKVSLALSSNIPIRADIIYKSGFNIESLDAVSKICDAISSKISINTAADSLIKLGNDKATLVLIEFIRELLKFKCRVSKDKLPLINTLDLNLLSKIQANTLFNTYNDLLNKTNSENQISNFAQVSTLYTLIEDLKNSTKRNNN